MSVECWRCGKGFTLVELIATLLIMAIVGSIVISRTTAVQGFEVAAEFDKVKTHLRLAQRKALRADTRWGIHFDNSTSYWLFRDDKSVKRKLPDQDTSAVSLRALTITNAPLTLTFDGSGSPGKNPVSILTNKGAIVVQGGTGFVE